MLNNFQYFIWRHCNARWQQIYQVNFHCSEHAHKAKSNVSLLPPCVSKVQNLLRISLLFFVPLAVAFSPSLCMTPWLEVGLTPTGNSMSWPRMLVRVTRWDTSRKHRGLSRYLSYSKNTQLIPSKAKTRWFPQYNISFVLVLYRHQTSSSTRYHIIIRLSYNLLNNRLVLPLLRLRPYSGQA